MKVILTRSLTFLYFLSSFSLAFSQRVGTEKFLSKYTGDTYTITIKKPKGYDTAKMYHVVYFVDASIKSGKYILGLDSAITKNCILVGIGHIGGHVMQRQRDFIPSDAGGYSDKKFGQASKFYLFMKQELMPLVDRKLGKQKSKVFIGHSFGGLMALYFSLKENKLFDQYFAISPSVWANYNELLKIEEKYNKANAAYNSTIHIYAGSLEVFNQVLSSTTKFYEGVKARNYKGLTIKFEEINWANHYSIVAAVIPRIFTQLK